MIPQMPFRFFGSLEGSFLTAAEPTTYAYSPHSSVYSPSTTLFAERGPRIIEPEPHASTEQDKPATGSESKQGAETDAASTPSQSSSPSSSRSSSPKRPAGVDLMSSAPRMNATRMMG